VSVGVSLEANTLTVVAAPRSQVTVDAPVSNITAGGASHAAPSGATVSSVSRARSRRVYLPTDGAPSDSKFPADRPPALNSPLPARGRCESAG